MPKRTIFVRDADLVLWQRAEVASGTNLSAFVSAALREYLEREEFKSAALEIDVHGPVTERALFVWASRDPDHMAAWGTSFSSDGTGPDQANALIAQLRRDPTVVSIEFEERRAYKDGWVDRRVMETWSSSDSKKERTADIQARVIKGRVNGSDDLQELEVPMNFARGGAPLTKRFRGVWLIRPSESFHKAHDGDEKLRYAAGISDAGRLVFYVWHVEREVDDSLRFFPSFDSASEVLPPQVMQEVRERLHNRAYVESLDI